MEHMTDGEQDAATRVGSSIIRNLFTKLTGRKRVAIQEKPLYHRKVLEVYTVCHTRRRMYE